MQSDVQILGTQINLLWIVIGAALVVFMQAGFAMVEAGFTRAKSAVNIMMKNLMDLIQEGNVGLMQAVKKFDPYKGIKFLDCLH